MLCYRFSSTKRYGCSRAAGTSNLPPNGRIASAQAIYPPMGVLPQHRQFTLQWAYYLSPRGGFPHPAQLASQPAQPSPHSHPASQPWPAQPSQPASPGQPTSQLTNQPTNQPTSNHRTSQQPAGNQPRTNQSAREQPAKRNQQPEGPAAGAKPSDIRRTPAGGAGRVQITTQLLQILKLQGPRPCRRPLPKVLQK